MLQLTQSELFSTRSSLFLNQVMGAMRSKVSQNMGVIQPHMIESALLDLKKYAKTKTAASPCLLDAIDLFENYGGRIQLFDLSSPSYGKSDIPSFFPFLPGNAKRPDMVKQIPAIYMNLFKLGTWNADDSQYEGIFPITDLHTCLESGFIAYKLIVERKADEIFANGTIVDLLTRIYTKLFYGALIKVPGNLPLVDFQQEAAKFIISKFFLVYILQKQEKDQMTNMLAKSASNCVSSVNALQSYEENLGIDYSKLSNFLNSFGMVFFNGHPTTLSDFERAWISMYGEGLALAVEYVPYLLHFLFAPIHASRLGGSSRLDKQLPNLQKEGLIKLYNAVISAVLR